jgi:immune inhibitor A
MKRGLQRFLGVLVILSMLLAVMPSSALANPPYPEGPAVSVPAPAPDQSVVGPAAARKAAVKPLDQPNIKDLLRNRERQRLLESAQVDQGIQPAQADALSLSGTDRVLVILVEFAGTDVLTWTQGVSTWDPIGKADPNEFTGTVGDCSNIITQTTVFTYSSPLHNQIPRPVSAADRSGDSIWTPDFSPAWFDSFMFGNGVTFNYTRTDDSLVNEDFTGKSVKQYYQEFSNNAYNIEGDIVGWLPLPHSTWWYGADQCPGARSGGGSNSGAIPGAGGSRSLVRDALDAVNAISNTIPGFDWADYDTNDDGVIDRLWIVHSGYGEEDSTTLLNRTSYGEAAMWSHSSAVTPVYSVTQNVAAGPYIMMPENGGIGVFAHEYGHNLGADDLYAYNGGETSAGFWTVMADDWTGYPIGFEPPAPDPWHLDNWGWLNPKVITDAAQVYTVTLGQASSFPGGAGVYRGAKIQLPTGAVPFAVPVWQGSYYWWGGKDNVANGMMTTKNPIAVPAGATLSFDLVYEIEDQWDFLWVQGSDDAGVTWKTITNTNTVCTHDPSWIGELYGFPADMCAAGIGGFTNYNASWPDPETETFDLSAFAGQNVLFRLWYMTDWGTTYTGTFVDNFKVQTSSATLFSDNAESGDANWDYAAPWIRSNGTQPFSHNIYLQWRNVGASGGYDSALGDSRWRYGPANTGLLVWYNNNGKTDNEVFSYLNEYPGYGPKGRMLVVDAHPDPYREPAMVAAGFNNEGGNVAHRGLMRDAPFSLQASVPFTMSNSYPYNSVLYATAFPGLAANGVFNDAFGYYPGAEYASRGPGYIPASYKWITKQWDASATVPSRSFYGIKAPGYVGAGAGQQEFRWDCASTNTGRLGCYWYGTNAGLGYNGGTGNPGDIGGQYGWHVQILNQTAATATVKIWNAMQEANQAFYPNKTLTSRDDTVQYTYVLTQNQGSALSLFACSPLDTNTVEYVAGSGTNNAVPLPTTCPAAAAQVASGGQLSAMAASPQATVAAVAWTGNVATTASANFSFQVKVKAVIGSINQTVMLFDQGAFWRTLSAARVRIVPAFQLYLPLVLRQ